MLNVTVIGFGNVGALLGTYLLNCSRRIKLNIMEPSEEAEGALLDLEHSMSLYPNNELHINQEVLFLKADFIFYTAGTPNKHGGSRLSTAKENIALCQEIFEAKEFKTQTYIIVISNPVDVVSYAVQHYSGLAANQVIGTGTFLDSIRLAYYLSGLSGVPTSDLESWVLGEHGASQVPVYSNCKIRGKALIGDPSITTGKLDRASEQTKKAAFTIRETQTGTKYGVVKCATRIFDCLVEEKEMRLPLSVLTNEHYRKLLQLDRDIYLSLPVQLKEAKVEMINEFSLTPEELKALRESAKILSDVNPIK